jgi:hypothetical protein
VADYQTEKLRRMEQFAHYLKLMHDRAHLEAEGPCFIIFNEHHPSGGVDNDSLSSEKHVEVELPLSVLVDDEPACLSGSLDESVGSETPDNFWRSDESTKRFIQFSFERKWFCLDIPRSTLFRHEAEIIMLRRHGFFYLRDRPEFTLYKEDVEGHAPFRKIYLYGDEESAAEDMAFILFDVWTFPVTSRFYVYAAAFGDKHFDWEKWHPIE